MCKQEFEDDNGFFKLSAAKPSGKKSAASYEICEDCAEKINVQLSSLKGKLPNGWFFGADYVVDDDGAKDVVDEESNTPTSDDAFVREKKEQIADREPVEAADIEFALGDDDGSCSHMNKSAVKIADGCTPYRVCRACNKKIPEKSAAQSAMLRNTKAPAGSRTGYHGNK